MPRGFPRRDHTEFFPQPRTFSACTTIFFFYLTAEHLAIPITASVCSEIVKLTCDQAFFFFWKEEKC